MIIQIAIKKSVIGSWNTKDQTKNGIISYIYLTKSQQLLDYVKMHHPITFVLLSISCMLLKYPLVPATAEKPHVVTLPMEPDVMLHTYTGMLQQFPIILTVHFYKAKLSMFV